jgi:hypothetical protein
VPPVPARRPSHAILAEAPPETLHVEALSKNAVASCLGVLVAPRVALTASHCLSGRSAARVRLVRSGGDAFVAVERFWFDPRQKNDQKNVDPHSADVAVLLLERPIALAWYPEFARRPAPGFITATGLRRSGQQIETTAINLRPPLGSAYYVSRSFAKPGDSGGPVFFVGPSGNRMVVAVTAGGSSAREVLTRVDLVAEAIDRAMAIAATGS